MSDEYFADFNKTFGIFDDNLINRFIYRGKIEHNKKTLAMIEPLFVPLQGMEAMAFESAHWKDNVYLNALDLNLFFVPLNEVGPEFDRKDS